MSALQDKDQPVDQGALTPDELALVVAFRKLPKARQDEILLLAKNSDALANKSRRALYAGLGRG